MSNDKVETKELEIHGGFDDVISELDSNINNSGLDKVKGALAIKMEQYDTLKLSKKQIKGLARQLQQLELGSSSGLVAICSKHKCLYKNRCTLYSTNSCPEGTECVHEFGILKDAMLGYVGTFDIKLDNYPEMVMVNQLVEFELIEYRCNAILSNDHTDMKMESIIGVDDEGKIITKEEISHALIIKDNNFKKKMQLMDAFTATRTAQWKKQAALKQTVEGPASILSSLKKRVLESKEINNAQIPEDIKPPVEINLLSDDY